MQHFDIVAHGFTLDVIKAPRFVRWSLFIIAYLLILLPLIVLIAKILDDSAPSFFQLFLFGLIILGGFYLLKLALWNSVGKEIWSWDSTYIYYHADYGWFKGNNQSIERNGLEIQIQMVGFEQDQQGVLVFTNGSKKIVSVVVRTTNQLEYWKTSINQALSL